MAAFASYAPTMIGGSADLVESNRTTFEGAGVFSRVHAGRNIPFGIREHGMGAIVNGAAAHGGIVKPYGATFLIFSDYMRGSVRLSALMRLPVIWAWTHDSVAVGEDGPTHQPIEHYASLRAIPNLWVMRPGDANEVTAAWAAALEREDGPVALMLSRQNIPVLDRSDVASADGLTRGGYVLWDSPGRDPSVILISTGAEVAPTLEAARSLAGEGTGVRVVSMPCMELFEAQPQSYRDEVLPPTVTSRLAVEPGASMSWWRWVGTRGDVLGIDHFGASAPGATVLREFGFSAENIAVRARALLDSTH
jgi:transketolase